MLGQVTSGYVALGQVKSG